MSSSPADSPPPSPDALAVMRGIGRLFARNDIWCLPEMPLRPRPGGAHRRADLMGIDSAGHLIIVEIKVSRADLLGDLKSKDKRDSYLDAGGQCWYVLGCDRKGSPIAQADEIPLECGVMVLQNERLEVLRNAPKRAVADLPFALWMVLAKATPLRAHADLGSADGPDQAMLLEHAPEAPTAPTDPAR
mgnify:CR=1 FL=1